MNLGAACAERVAPRLRLQILGLRNRVGAVSEKMVVLQEAGFVRQRKPADETPLISLEPAPVTKSLLPSSGQVYDPREIHPNRKSRLDDLFVPWGLAVTSVVADID